jgi:adenine-specific DNA-methyltransferase
LANTQAAIRTMRGIQQSFPLTAFRDSERLPAVDPKGVVYTKRWVVELLLDLAGYTSGMNLVDAVAVEPAAGEGAFLGLMAARLADSCQRLGRPISDSRNALIAYELDEVSAERARILVVRVLVDKGVEATTAEDLAQSWVRTGDYLVDSMTIEADFVIGNPPYIRLEEIPEETATLYRDAYPTMRGRADLYVAFFEAALRQLRDGGTCAFICADRWMRNHYGAELRDVVTSSFAVDVIVEMHNADAFHDEVDAYPAITIIRRHHQATTVVASASLEVESIPTQTLLTALLNSSAGEKAAMPGLRAARVDTWFQGRDPWPCQSPEQLALLRQLEEKFPPLEASARVGIGVATGNDKVFVTKDADLVEPSRLLKLAMARDIASGSMIWSGHYLVDPWDSNGLVKLDNYPRLRRYFEQHGDALKRRHTAIKNTHAWYKTIDRVAHVLTETRKLYIADIKNVLDPVLDNGETYPHHNLYFIESDDWNLEVLGGLLISAVGQFFIESYGVRMRGGYMRFQAQYLRRIRIPHPNAVSNADGNELVKAFRSRDRHLATQTALRIYRIDGREMEIVIGH